MSRAYSSSRPWSGPSVRINGKIRAREVRVIATDGRQIGVLPLAEAILLARNAGMDLVEVAPNATPPVCRIVDFGKYQYELAKKEKEARKHQHSNRVKEIQLRPVIDPHDFGVKLDRAVDFLCDNIKVKLTLRFRGREMRHQELGTQVMEKFIKELGPYGQPVEEPKIVGRGMTVMINPLPRAKRAKNPRAEGASAPTPSVTNGGASAMAQEDKVQSRSLPAQTQPGAAPPPSGFVNNPFAVLESSEPASSQGTPD